MRKYKNKSVINKDCIQDAKSVFTNSENWKNYASRIGRNVFMRNYLFHSYDGICQYCGKDLDPKKFVIHHKTYLHKCIYDNIIETPHPTEKRPKAKWKSPDCLTCSSQTPDAFNECTARIVPVCTICNYIINQIYTRQHPEK